MLDLSGAIYTPLPDHSTGIMYYQFLLGGTAIVLKDSHFWRTHQLAVRGVFIYYLAPGDTLLGGRPEAFFSDLSPIDAGILLEKLVSAAEKNMNNQAFNWNTGTGDDMEWNPLGGKPYTPPKWPRGGENLILNWLKLETLAAMDKDTVGFVPAKRLAELERAFKDLEFHVMTSQNIPWTEQSALRMTYFKWLCDRGYQASPAGATDPAKLDELELESLPILERIITAGYRTLAKSAHPDMENGSPERFQQLKEAKGQLEALIKELKEVLK